MNRPILFKAISLETGKWVEGQYVQELQNFYASEVMGTEMKIEHMIWWVEYIDRKPFEQHCHSIDPETLCQLVIPAEGDRPALWEGDVVLALRNNRYHVVTWDSFSCWYSVDDIEHRGALSILSKYNHTGKNIHDKEQGE